VCTGANNQHIETALAEAVRSLETGRYGVAVSGGPDSVALLMLLHRYRPDLYLHVIHLDHETRAGESALDARFVAELAQRLRLPCTMARRSDIEPRLRSRPANRSALYRAVRLELFRLTALRERLAGVVLAHHADDQAETVFHRLMRGAAPSALASMAPDTMIGGVRIIRPLLEIPRQWLRRYLLSIGQDWREDSSNASDVYLRNRIRRVLTGSAQLRQAALDLGRSAAALRQWLRTTAPRLPASVSLKTFQAIPPLLADEAARRWLADRGAPPEEITAKVVRRLLEMACDLASPSRQVFPGGIVVARRGGKIAAINALRGGGAGSVPPGAARNAADGQAPDANGA